MVVSVHWFRKGLRLHDNPALLEACRGAEQVFPVFVIDPHFASPERVGVNRYRFLLESLTDLDGSLRGLGSRLFVCRGRPEEAVPGLLRRFAATRLTFESDTEPYAKRRDAEICRTARAAGVEIRTFPSHTLHDPERYLAKLGGKDVPTAYTSFLRLFDSMGPVPKPLNPPVAAFAATAAAADSAAGSGKAGAVDDSQKAAATATLKRKGHAAATGAAAAAQGNEGGPAAVVTIPPDRSGIALDDPDFLVPTLEEMGYPADTLAPAEAMTDAGGAGSSSGGAVSSSGGDGSSGGGGLAAAAAFPFGKAVPGTKAGTPAGGEAAAGPRRFPGGETEALARLERHMARGRWVAEFEKPNTSPNSLEPSTTVLSPYVKFGCLGARRFWHAVAAVLAAQSSGGRHSAPPVSLHGQLLWREHFYLCGHAIPNFGRMEGNPICRQIPWRDDPELLAAWEEGRTGYPFIDAIQTQLRTEGWIHHLARHASACFLTRGDLWQSWEAGAAVFDRLLLDADWSLNSANWMWLSCSAFFYQFFRVYSPVAFGKKTDPKGTYIRRYLPQLAKYPDKYIYEPWTAPLSVQRGAKCVIGRDYPAPVVDHKAVSKENMSRMKAAYDAYKSGAVAGSSSGGGRVETGEGSSKVRGVESGGKRLGSEGGGPSGDAASAAKRSKH